MHLVSELSLVQEQVENYVKELGKSELDSEAIVNTPARVKYGIL